MKLIIDIPNMEKEQIVNYFGCCTPKLYDAFSNGEIIEDKPQEDIEIKEAIEWFKAHIRMSDKALEYYGKLAEPELLKGKKYAEMAIQALQNKLQEKKDDTD